MIPDFWTQPNVKIEYLGLAALLINKSFKKELVILGFVEMREGHTAEQTKMAIENIVNKFKFKKSKIQGKLYLFKTNFVIIK